MDCQAAAALGPAGFFADPVGPERAEQLSRAELQEMALLYRQVAADLSVLRRDETARTYTDHVNQLLARAHHIIYSRQKTTWLTLFRFLKDEYPAIFQRQLPYVAASLLVTVAWAAAGRGADDCAAGVHAALRGAGDDCDDGAAQDVDGLHRERGAERDQPHHDQQPLGELYGVCRGDPVRGGHVLSSL